MWLRRGMALLALLMIALYALIVVYSSPGLPLRPDQIEALANDPHKTFYAARRYEELSRYNPLRRIPRSIAISILTGYFLIARKDYVHTVARHIPVRVNDSTRECVAGLQNASDRLFKKPVESFTEEELERIIRFSVAPQRHPLATQENEMGK